MGASNLGCNALNRPSQREPNCQKDNGEKQLSRIGCIKVEKLDAAYLQAVVRSDKLDEELCHGSGVSSKV